MGRDGRVVWDHCYIGCRDSRTCDKQHRFSFNNHNVKRFPGIETVTQLAESLPSMYKALGSVPSTAQT